MGCREVKAYDINWKRLTAWKLRAPSIGPTHERIEMRDSDPGIRCHRAHVAGADTVREPGNIIRWREGQRLATGELRGTQLLGKRQRADGSVPHHAS